MSPARSSPDEFPAPFPLGWYRDVLETLRRRDVDVVTYRDLFADSDDFDFESCYEREFRRWHERRDPNRITLVIQHDVDFVPPFTDRVMRLEMEFGYRSNVFVFAERDRSNVPPDSPYGDEPYELDHNFLAEAESRGFVVGYHQNALNLAGPDLDAAVERFRGDVRSLRDRHRIDFFCPHGGPACVVDGVRLHNHHVPVPEELRTSLRWVYNRYGVRFSGRWSDGGLRRLADPARLERLDVVDAFLERMEPGKRYLLLTHPQLWGMNVDPDYNPRLREQSWYRRVCARHGVELHAAG